MLFRSGAAALASLQNMILSQQNSHASLPPDFYTVQLPAHFSSTPANSFNILDQTGNGFKYYQIRNNLNSGNAIGGGLQNNTRLNQARYLQFGIKFYF